MSSNIAHSPMMSGAAPASVDSMAGARLRHEAPQWALDVLVDGGLAAFLVLDGSRITYASPAFLELVGWETSKGTRPASLLELISDTDCARVLAGLASAGDQHSDICALRRANGAEAYVAFDAATIQR